MKMLRGLMVIVLLTTLPLVALSTVIVQDYDFSRPELSADLIGDIVVMDNCRTSGTAGAPALPTSGVKLLLPPGEIAISVEIITGEIELLVSGIQIAPHQEQVPLSYTAPFEEVAPDAEIYSRNELYPAQLSSEPHTHFYRGHGLAFFHINPVRYNPVAGEVWWYPHMRVEVHTAPAAEATTSMRELYRGDADTESALFNMVSNIELLSEYPADSEDRIEDLDMVIITSDALLASFEPLAAFNNRRGIHTVIETTSWIYANVTGVDNQDRIRNHIINCYQDLNLQYVLLAGDGDTSGAGNIVPYRGVQVNTHYGLRETDNNLPCDLYYGGLDGNWNSDGDGQFGEENPEEADFIAEVHVGRAAVDNPTEAANFVNKHISYQQSPVTADCDEVLIAGELLWDDGGGWTFGRTYMEEIRLGSSNHGYTTIGVDNPALADTLYDQYTYYPGEWSASSHLRPRLNNGVNYFNHLGHCNWDYMARMYNSDINTGNFTNNGIVHGFYIVYSQGCICGAFNENDCFSENWTVGIPTGAVAIVSNARYGWGYHNSTRGSSQYFDREFVDAIYGEGITSIARANDDSKVDCLPWINSDDMANRWCALELNLFGDPSLDIWTAEPGLMTADHNPAYVIGTGFFDVTVPGVDGALVALSFAGELVARGVTNANGNVQLQLDPAPLLPGEMELVVTAHDYQEYSGSVSVIPPEGAYVVIESCVVADANGELNPGETPLLTIGIRNVGIETAPAVNVTITTADSWVAMLDPIEFYGDMDPDETIVLPESFQVTVASDAPENHLVHFDVQAIDNDGGVWNSGFDLPILYIYEQYWSNDCESETGWTHDSPDDWVDQWHLSSLDYQSPTHSWKCGDTGTGDYANHMDARLVSPEVELRPWSRLSFIHRMSGEVSGAYPDSAYDGGFLEMSNDGGDSWNQLMPLAGGYTSAFRWESGGGSPATHPFDGGTRCWSGEFDWQTTEVNLSDYAGETASFRFSFGSDDGGGNSGWYIDDLALVGVTTGGPEAVTDLYIAIAGSFVTLSWSGVEGAASYNIYSCNTPYGEFQLIGNSTIPQWSLLSGATEQFYQVTALDH
jgi:hypothetical protein